MLRPAQLYAEELNRLQISTWYELENQYYSGTTGSFVSELPDNNCNLHSFVSVDKDDNILGYLVYSVDWRILSADSFGMISYQKGNLQFVRDVYKQICTLFEDYHLNRISWRCVSDNPAVKGYRNFIKRHGGKECAHYRQVCRCMDGKLHDDVSFEILSEEFHK